MKSMYKDIPNICSLINFSITQISLGEICLWLFLLIIQSYLL